MANAKVNGVHIGRQELTKDDIPAIFYRRYPFYISGELNVLEFARVCDMSITRAYRGILLVEKLTIDLDSEFFDKKNSKI
jgi:hypothetical protein